VNTTSCRVLTNQFTRLNSTQIRKLTYAIKNSSTIALPQWHRIVENLGLEPRILPRDTRTRWNATYEMLNVAYQYKKAINKITDMRDMKLRQYEIEGHEWKLVWQLRDLLKVTHALLYFFLLYLFH
jgi:hypothetical protein